MSKRTWKDMESLHGSTSTVPILNILQELGEEDFKLFKSSTNASYSVAILSELPRVDTSVQIMQSYQEKALDITMDLLKLINRNDLVERFSLTGTPTKDVRDVAESSCSSLLTSSSQPPQQDLLVKTQERAHPIAFYQARLKTNVEDPFACVPEGTIQMTDKQHFVGCYTRLSVIYVDVTELSSEHEVTMMDLKKAGKDIQLSDIFEHPSGQNIHIRTVLSVGIAGVGKSFLVHKFVFDWARKNLHPHLIFVFQFRQLNLLQGQSFCLAQLIHKCIDATKFIPEEALNYIFTTMQMSGISNYDKSPFKLLFILDGLDESSLKLNFSHDCSDDFTQSSLLEDLLVNLIKGKLLRGAHIWITSRPAAAKLIPSALVDIVTEVQGFTDNMKEQYIRNRFIDENQAKRILSHLKASSNLFTMCEIPVFCSVTATVLHYMLRRDENSKLPDTQTDMYCHFLLVQTRRMKEKYKTELNPEELIMTYRAVLLKLGRLAFEHLQKGNLIFCQKDLEKCDLDIKEGTLYSGLCTEIFKRDSDCFQETVYCFVHLSIQEFLAAVYLFHCFTERNVEVLETFLDDRSEHQKLLPNSMSQFELNSMDDFLKKAFLKAQKSENGHLDFFIRFLHGLSLETNQRLLRFLLGHTEISPESIQKTISNLKEMHTDDASPDSCITIFLCLIEMKDHEGLEQEIKKYLSSFKISKREHLVKSVISLRLILEIRRLVLEVDELMSRNAMKGRLFPAIKPPHLQNQQTHSDSHSSAFLDAEASQGINTK